MKISIDFKKISGPYGGGNQFVTSLERFLVERGHRVVFDLKDGDIDIILMVSPIPGQQSGAYSYLDTEEYTQRNRRTLIVQRVNICDKGRGTRNLDGALRRANSVSDYTIFISEWLHLIWQKQCWIKSPAIVIRNGADTDIFNSFNKSIWDGKEKMQIVTHHWSPNINKGHDIYEYVDRLLDRKPWRDLFEMTYIGNIPNNRTFKNIKILPPLSGGILAEKLKRHHVYITAAKFEAAGMHHIEAACCGLPLIYRNSGALPEYCAGFGISFDGEDIGVKLLEMYDGYGKYSEAIKKYPFSAELTNTLYLNFFEKIMSKAPVRIKRKSSLLSFQIKFERMGYESFLLLKKIIKHILFRF